MSIYETLFDLGDKIERRDELAAVMEGPSFWGDQEKAKVVIAELKSLNGVIKPFEALVRQADDLSTMIELAEEDGGDDFDQEIRDTSKKAEADFQEFELHERAGRTTVATRYVCRSTPAWAGPRLATGPRCSCGCT